MSIEYLDRYFHFDKSLVKTDPTFVEIGSYSGGNMKRLLRSFPEARIIIYEAGLENFKKLKSVYEAIGSPSNVSIYNEAVSRSEGKITFFKNKKKPSSNSIFERHTKKKSLVVERKHTVKSTNIAGIIKSNGLSNIDVIFANAEGIEIMLLDEVSLDKEVGGAVSQLCLSMHERIVGKEAIRKALGDASKLYSIKRGDGKWACHLFRRKDLVNEH